MKIDSPARRPFAFALQLSVLLITYFVLFHGLAAAVSDEPNQGRNLDEQEIQQIFDRGWRAISQIHIDKNGLDEAILLYHKVLASYPRHKDIHWKLSEITFKKAETISTPEISIKLYEKSLDFAKTALDLNPHCFESHFWVGCCSARLADMYSTIRAAGIIGDSISELKRAIATDPDHRLASTAKAILAAIYLQMPWPMRDLAKAEEFARAAVSQNPNLTLASLHLANVYAKRKAYRKALQEITRCLSIEQPTYIWDAELYDWPAARKLKLAIESKIKS